MTLRKENIEAFKKELLARRNALAQEIHETTEGFINDDEPFYADSVDQASADAGKTLTLQIKNREHGILAQIDGALRRIDQGTFGVCEECGESIAVARMKANPSTTLCIDCKAELESEQQRYSGRL